MSVDAVQAYLPHAASVLPVFLKLEQGSKLGLMLGVKPAKERLKGVVNPPTQTAQRTEARIQLLDAPTRRLQPLAHQPKGLHVGAAKAVDRLLLVADDKEAARLGVQLQPIAFFDIFARQIEQQLGLNGIGVLKLVDKEGLVARLKIAAHGRMIAQQILGAQQQVLEGHAAGGQPLPIVKGYRIVDKRNDVGVDVLTPLR